MDAQSLQSAVDAIPFWYHRIELPHGVVTPGTMPLSFDAYRIPDDLRGKMVLDIGAWDGYWTFAAVARGADVVAIEDYSDTIGGNVNASRHKKGESFELCRRALGIQDKCRLIELSAYQLATFVYKFDAIFCFGVLYHLRHPLLALERMRDVCGGTLHIETAILDGSSSSYGDNEYSGAECVAEFYPGAEYGRNPSNWHVGTLKYWCAMVSAAGFRNIECWKLTNEPKHISECRGFIRASI